MIKTMLCTSFAALAAAVFSPAVPEPGLDGLVKSMVVQEETGGSPAKKAVEIRSYNLKPGTEARFQQLFLEDAFPLLRRAGIDVVAYGPSLHDPQSWFLMRSFASLDDRQASEDAFYGSDAWRQGPRNAILECIESYTTVVVELDDATIERLRTAGAGSG